ncbi:FAD-dependent monooxygenase [Amycolatopsis nigrescens]|uniref:FAD-dependent monooxygenase n=1 Tax=Amycolatopsis nigrescens TaxID=381445 RepID=UPI000377D864|nr:FAD-dependent monooxygenase [Amycolatopsis nigrescens]
MSEPRVAIVGAGIGGLTLALALRRHGIAAEVYEQALELQEVGAAVGLTANGTRLLERLGLGAGLEANGTMPAALVYRNWLDGRRIAEYRGAAEYVAQFGARMYGVHRAVFQRLLLDAVGDGVVRMAHQLTGIERAGGELRLEFADGASATADVLVGADGVHSTVRRWLTGGEHTARYSGTSAFRGLVPLDRLPALPEPDAIQFWMGPGAHLLHYRLGGEVNFLAVVEGPSRWHEPAWVVDVEPGANVAAFEGWHPAVTELVGGSTMHQRWALFAHEPLRHWVRDGVALLGDAAHAMLPHHGQGANQTIEDAVALADCLAAAEPRIALRRYERLRRARTRMVQHCSRQASPSLHLPDGPAARLRDSELAEPVEAFAWIHGYDVQRETGRVS